MTSTANIDQLYTQHLQQLTHQFSSIFSDYNCEGILIDSGRPSIKFLDDQHYPYKSNPHFRYWLPLTKHPNCFLWLTPNNRPKLFYFLKTDFWHKMAQAPDGHWTKHFDITCVSDVDDVKKELSGKCAQVAYIGESPELVKDWKFLSLNNKDLLTRIHYLRTQKTPYELYCLQQASKRAVPGHLAAYKSFTQGASELEIHLNYLTAVGSREQDQPYDNIMAINENASILHYTTYGTQRTTESQRHCFLIDAGAEFNGYASDITRTYAYGENEFKDLVQAIEQMQLRIISELKLGVSYTDNHLKCHSYTAEILHQFKFIHLSVDEIVEKGLTKTFFPHGLGHFLGLQVHDVGGTKDAPPAEHPYLRCTQTIKEGHCFTIEPGLYFIDPLLSDLKKSKNSKAINWEKIDQFRKFGGIRIEDNIYVHSDSFENLTRNAFNELG